MVSLHSVDLEGHLAAWPASGLLESSAAAEELVEQAHFQVLQWTKVA